MVTHIQLHRSGVTGATPDVATLFEGEPAVNFPDKKLYIKDDNGLLLTLVEPAPVRSVNGSTGDVTVSGGGGGVETFNGLTGDVQGVGSFNGLTGDVQGVGSFNGLTGTVDTSTLLIHADGISADGATFGGGVTFNNNVYIPTQYATIGQSSSKIQFNGAGGQMVLDSDAVDIQRKLRHNGDADTLLQFDTDQVTLTAGNTKLLEGNANGVLHVPTGVSGGGATFSENVSIENAGDISLTIKGDTDNSGENDNPLIRLEQDGGQVSCNIGINGDSNNQFTGAQPNAFYIESTSNSTVNQLIQFATNNADVMTLNGDGNVGINTSVPRQKLEVVGTVQTPGVSADGATFSGASFGAITISDLVNNAYALPAADGSAGQVMMTDGSDSVSFQTIKFTANFILDSDVPLATGSRDKAIYMIPYDNAVITDVILRSEDAAASGDTTSLVVALEAIQRSTNLDDADPATGSTIMSATLNDIPDDHYDLQQGLSHAIGADNNAAFLRINVTDNSGNHTHCQVMVKMEARTT